MLFGEKREPLAPLRSLATLRGNENAFCQRLVMNEAREHDRTNHTRRRRQRFIAEPVLRRLGVEPTLHLAQKAATDLREGAPHRPRLPSTLGAKRCDYAAVFGVERVLLGEVCVEHLGGRLVPGEQAPFSGMCNCLGDELVAISEMDVKTPVREPGKLHELRDAHRVDPILPQRACSRANNAGADALLVAFGISHSIMIVIPSTNVKPAVKRRYSRRRES